MTADSSDNETESRLNEYYSTEVRSIGGQDGAPSGARDGLEGGRIWKDGNGRERKRDAGTGNGDLNDGFSGSSDLNIQLKRSRKDVQEATEMDKDEEARGRNEKEKRRLTRDGRNLETAQPSEEDRDEETEDDFEELDGAIADVVAKHGNQQGPPQSLTEEQSGRADRSQLQQQQESQPLPQTAPAATAGWESFLPQKQLRVLLAEDDDSTRHVVGALLRNCSYEVTSAANGMQAWEMLEDPNNRFDLVLTDVVMPCLSGVGLLTKIMSREAGKRVPVIMMSSHDSLDIVFRCLSKGAADFLVKPVRKNELKNLWQHVWRCQSSSGSGSGSGGSRSGTGKATQPKSRVGSGNNSGSNDGSEDGSSGLNVRGGSDNGSGTQTVAVHVQTREKQKRDREEGQATSLQKVSDEEMGQDLEMATRRPGSVELQEAEQAKQHNENVVADGVSPVSSEGNDAEQMEEGYNSGAANSGGSAKAIDLIGGIACQNNEDVKEGDDSDGAEGSDRGASNSPVMNEKYASGSSLPTLELSLKRSRVPGDDDADFEERQVVRQSGGSAFSRYSTSGVIIQQHHPSATPLGFGGYTIGAPYSLASGQTCLGTSKTGQLHLATPLDRSGSSRGSGEASTLANHPHLPQQGSGQDMGSGVIGSCAQDGYANCRHAKDESASVSPGSGPGMPISRPGAPPCLMYDGVSPAYGPPMHPAFYSHPAAPQWATGPAHKSNRGKVFDHPPYRDHVSHHHSHHHQPHLPQHHHQHHHHSHMPQTSLRSTQDDQTVTNQGPGAPRCGSSNMAGDGNTGQSGSSNGYGSTGNGNGSVNGSASGSNNLSNQNGQSGVPVPTSGNGGNNGDSGSGNAVTANAGIVDPEQNRFARREAALNKFRQKRKERCFEKKVRYQSRKRLAEQRPRVRGQFVRQTVYDVNTGEAVE